MGQKGSDFLGDVPDNIWKYQKQLAGDVRVIFDLGAHKGRVTGRYLELFPEATIYAFEPALGNIKKFHKYIAGLGNKRRIRLVKKAALDYTGKTEFYLTTLDMAHSVFKCLPQPSIGKITVPCITLDDFCRQKRINRIDILKMDVEGAELRVLHGAKGLLEKNQIGMIYSELLFYPVHEGQSPMWKICEFLDRYGFELHSFWKDRSERHRVLEGNGLFIKKGVENESASC